MVGARRTELRETGRASATLWLRRMEWFSSALEAIPFAAGTRSFSGTIALDACTLDWQQPLVTAALGAQHACESPPAFVAAQSRQGTKPIPESITRRIAIHARPMRSL